MPVGDWIRVEDRLPEDMQSVMFFVPNGAMKLLGRPARVFTGIFIKGKGLGAGSDSWHTYVAGSFPNPNGNAVVTQWQPIEEPKEGN